MTEYNVGDLVEAVKGDTVIRGRLERVYDCSGFWVGDSTKLLSSLEAGDFTLTVIERATPSLPTEPGWYLASEGTAVYLAADGYWTTPTSFGVTGEGMGNYAPFTRLEPVPVTAKKVLDRMKDKSLFLGEPRDCTFRVSVETVDELLAEFGVTEP